MIHEVSLCLLLSKETWQEVARYTLRKIQSSGTQFTVEYNRCTFIDLKLGKLISNTNNYKTCTVI